MNTGNAFRTTLLLGGLTGFFLLIGNLLGGTFGMIFAFGFAVLLNMGAWWFSGPMALRMSRAVEVSPDEMPDLHRMVAQLSERANMPRPGVYLIDTPMPNAFATGRSPQHGAVAVTTGILDLLDHEELAGVIAHELAHIKHRDTLISSIAATIGGAITMLADMAMWSMIFGAFSDDDGGGMGEMVGGLLMIVLAPIAAIIIQMAISRSREYGADRGGAEILGNPLPLARALRKLENWQASMADQIPPREQPNPATSHLYIVPAGGLAGLFRTHPATDERVRRLEAMA